MIPKESMSINTKNIQNIMVYPQLRYGNRKVTGKPTVQDGFQQKVRKSYS